MKSQSNAMNDWEMASVDDCMCKGINEDVKYGKCTYFTGTPLSEIAR